MIWCVVAGMADRVAVMYAGKIVEVGTVEEVFHNPQHSFTHGGLLNSMPTTETTSGSLESIPGTPPDLLNPPVGDAFVPEMHMLSILILKSNRQCSKFQIAIMQQHGC